MMKYRLLIAILSVLVFTTNAMAQNTPPEVTNVTAQQRDDSNLVDIYYDLQDPDNSTLLVRVFIRNKGVNVNASSLTCDKGFQVSPGNEKHVVWDAGADFFNQFSDSMQVEIEANDESATQSGFSELFTVDTRIDKPPVDGWQFVTKDGSTRSESMVIDRNGRIWILYIKSNTKRPDYYLKIINPNGYVYKSERVVAHGSALVTGKHQTIRAAVNEETGEVWAVFQGSKETNPTGFFIIFNDTGGVHQDSTALVSSTGKVNAPKITAAPNGDMWFSWHGGTPRTNTAKGEFIRYFSNGEPDGNATVFDDDGGLFNTDIAVSMDQKIWLVREQSEPSYGLDVLMHNYDRSFFSSFVIAADNFYFDPRPSIYVDRFHDRIWVLQKNTDSTLYRLNGYYLENNNLRLLPAINLAGICSFSNVKNRKVEILRYTEASLTYEKTVYRKYRH